MFSRLKNSDHHPHVHTEHEDRGRRHSRLWSDAFGTLASRSLQTIIVVILAAAIIIGLHQLSTVVIPILLALIFASTFHPLMAWLRQRGVPSLLATIAVLVSILVVIGLVAWLITWAVASQWGDLSSQAERGIHA